MSKPTLYVAGPMSGLPEFNYPAFNAAADALRDAGYSVLNPAEIDPDDHPDGEPDWQWYMRKALAMVVEADAIALLPGWTESKGATLGAHVGEALGMRMWTVQMWLRAGATP